MLQKLTRKKLILVVIVITMILSSGCKQNVGTSEDNPVMLEEVEIIENKYRFAYSGIDMENPYFDTLYSVIRESLEWEEHILLLRNPAGDVEVQREQLLELIDLNIDAVFVAPVDWEKIIPAIEQLKEAGIKIINIDTQIKDTAISDAYIGSNNNQAGKICGEVLMEEYPEGAKLVLVESPNTNSINDRITGLEETISNAGFTMVARIDGESSKTITQEQLFTLLKENPDTEVIICGNDLMAHGALEAIEELNLDTKVISIDGSPQVKSYIQEGNEHLIGTIAQSPISIGKTAAEVAVKLLNGDTIDKNTRVDTFYINQDNVDIYGVESWQ